MTIKKNPQTVTVADSKSFQGNCKIIDIRRDPSEVCLSKSIRRSLQGAKDAGPSIPQTLLWNDKGLRLFESIARLEEYYLTHDELEILEHRSKDIAMMIKPYSIVIDLGSG